MYCQFGVANCIVSQIDSKRALSPLADFIWNSYVHRDRKDSNTSSSNSNALNSKDVDSFLVRNYGDDVYVLQSISRMTQRLQDQSLKKARRGKLALKSDHLMHVYTTTTELAEKMLEEGAYSEHSCSSGGVVDDDHIDGKAIWNIVAFDPRYAVIVGPNHSTPTSHAKLKEQSILVNPLMPLVDVARVLRRLTDIVPTECSPHVLAESDRAADVSVASSPSRQRASSNQREFESPNGRVLSESCSFSILEPTYYSTLSNIGSRLGSHSVMIAGSFRTSESSTLPNLPEVGVTAEIFETFLGIISNALVLNIDALSEMDNILHLWMSSFEPLRPINASNRAMLLYDVSASFDDSCIMCVRNVEDEAMLGHRKRVFALVNLYFVFHTLYAEAQKSRSYAVSGLLPGISEFSLSWNPQNFLHIADMEIMDQWNFKDVHLFFEDLGNYVSLDLILTVCSREGERQGWNSLSLLVSEDHDVVQLMKTSLQLDRENYDKILAGLSLEKAFSYLESAVMSEFDSIQWKCIRQIFDSQISLALICFEDVCTNSESLIDPERSISLCAQLYPHIQPWIVLKLLSESEHLSANESIQDPVIANLNQAGALLLHTYYTVLKQKEEHADDQLLSFTAKKLHFNFLNVLLALSYIDSARELIESIFVNKNCSLLLDSDYYDTALLCANYGFFEGVLLMFYSERHVRINLDTKREDKSCQPFWVTCIDTSQDAWHLPLSISLDALVAVIVVEMLKSVLCSSCWCAVREAQGHVKQPPQTRNYNRRGLWTDNNNLILVLRAFWAVMESQAEFSSVAAWKSVAGLILSAWQSAREIVFSSKHRRKNCHFNSDSQEFPFEMCIFEELVQTCCIALGPDLFEHMFKSQNKRFDK